MSGNSLRPPSSQGGKASYGATSSTEASPALSPEPPAEPKPNVLIYSALLLFFAAGNSIFFKKMTNAMPNYPYVPIFFGAVFWEMTFTKNITEEMTNFPKYNFLMMGVFDSVAGVLMLFGGVHTAGSTQALLGNSIIPITMGLSVIFLKTSFKYNHYLGACIILAGVFVVILPQLANSGGGDDQPLFNFIFLLAVVPGAFSSIYKQLIFGDVDIGANYLQAWVALFQVFIGLCLMPLNSLHFLGDNYMPLSEMLNSMINGFWCMLGDDVVTTNCWRDAPTPGLRPCDHCAGSWSVIGIYLLLNCTYNVIIVLFVKYFGAAYLYAIMTLRLPILQFAFALPLISNPPETIKWEGILGLVLIVAGIVAYRWSSVVSDEKELDFIMPHVGPAVHVAGRIRPAAPVKGRNPVQARQAYLSTYFYLYVMFSLAPLSNPALWYNLGKLGYLPGSSPKILTPHTVRSAVPSPAQRGGNTPNSIKLGTPKKHGGRRASASDITAMV